MELAFHELLHNLRLVLPAKQAYSSFSQPRQFLLDKVPLLALAALDSRQGVRGLVLISLLYLSHHKDSLFLPVSPTRPVCLYLSHHENSLSEARAEPGCHVQPPLLPHAPVVGGLGKAEVTVGHVGTHRPLAGANRPLCPLGESAGRALPRVGPPPPLDPVD